MRFSLIHSLVFVFLIFIVAYSLYNSYFNSASLAPSLDLKCGDYAEGKIKFPAGSSVGVDYYLDIPNYNSRRTYFEVLTRELVFESRVGSDKKASIEQSAKDICRGNLVITGSTVSGVPLSGFIDSFSCDSSHNSCIADEGFGCIKEEFVKDDSKSGITYDCQWTTQAVTLTTQSGGGTSIPATRNIVTCTCSTSGGSVVFSVGCSTCKYRS